MEQNVFDVLKERGFIEQTTHEAEIRELLGKEKVTFYIGFDATADSLTAGHFLTIMAMMHMQRAGHRPIALLGGGTTMIGDPSGKSDMRNMMTKEKIDYNAKRFHEQLSRFIDFDNDKAIIANNADWLLDLNYVEFLREIGVHFSVNKMLTAECYKQRMERGLTFFEFNYMLMQSYDFLKLNQLYGCQMELGGNDQWSNILGGVDLIRRKEQKPAYGLTFKLLTTSEGIKMGKTMKGAVWLDPEKTSPYEFYQYWRNIEDVKVEECLGLLDIPSDGRSKKTGCTGRCRDQQGKRSTGIRDHKDRTRRRRSRESTDCCKSTVCTGRKDRRYPDHFLPGSRAGRRQRYPDTSGGYQTCKEPFGSKKTGNTGRCFCQ